LQRWRIATYLLFEEPRSSQSAQALSVLILVCIVLSITAFLLETEPSLKGISDETWLILEVVCTAVFTGEYLVRLLVCDVAGSTVCKFLQRPMNVVDLFAVLPFYVWLCMQSFKLAKALGVLRTLRLVRLFRIFKLGRYSSGLQLMMVALKNSSQALWVLCFFLGMGMLLFSSMIYYVEKMMCPERPLLAAEPLDDGSPRTQLDQYLEECHARRESQHGLCCDEHDAPLDFPSIIEASWWAIVTMTTVGFGEVRPRTAPGMLVGTLTMLSGILLIALPIAIIGRKFQEAYEKHQPRDAGYKEKKAALEDNACPTMIEMGKRLRLMQLPDSNLASLAMELSQELEQAAAMQKEILSMQTYEQAKQAEVVVQFDQLLTKFCELSDMKSMAVHTLTTSGRNKAAGSKRAAPVVKSQDAVPAHVWSAAPGLPEDCQAAHLGDTRANVIPGSVWEAGASTGQLGDTAGNSSAGSDVGSSAGADLELATMPSGDAPRRRAPAEAEMPGD